MICPKSRKGVALVLAMVVLTVISVWAVSICSLSGTNLQLADNQVKYYSALAAAESALDCGKYVVAETVPLLPSTPLNFVSVAEADLAWSTLCARVQAQPWVNGQAQENSSTIITPLTPFGSPTASFRLRFLREGTHTVKVEGLGSDGPVTRTVAMELNIAKDTQVLEYALASRGRVWITGDSTIHGSIYSDWDRPDLAPFNLTSDSVVEGTVNTVMTLQEIQDEGAFQFETLDANGNPVFDEYGNRIVSPEDEIQGYHEGINYGQQQMNMPGMDVSHYGTDEYKNYVLGIEGNGNIPSSDTIVTEYFPHTAGDYTYPRDGSPSNTWNRRLDRHVYQDQTFYNVRLPDNYNALFRNCTFEGVLYIDCYKSGSDKYNNVRFQDCEFNGVIVTDVPERFKWQHNCLYFTGEAAFNNTTDIQEATILAPHFNVNLGNTNPEQSDNNVLTGAIIGGIVDVRGNARIDGTIISMCDTTRWSSGYVTNIGATLNDGGSETTELGDIGVIEITPDQDKKLPSGITSPIVIRCMQETYTEGS
jgi:hypothetical protein